MKSRTAHPTFVEGSSPPGRKSKARDEFVPAGLIGAAMRDHVFRINVRSSSAFFSVSSLPNPFRYLGHPAPRYLPSLAEMRPLHLLRPIGALVRCNFAP